MSWLRLKNCGKAINLDQIPNIEYPEFYQNLVEMLEDENFHIADYFGYSTTEGLKLIAIILDDKNSDILIAEHTYHYYCEDSLLSITAKCEAMHPFERDITERYGIVFKNNPWNKPLRFLANRFDKRMIIEKYPFYQISGETLHEVNVGPIHAGIIEPGAFRFTCNGEKVLHLEVALGYQHRGVEEVMCNTKSTLKQNIIAENIAGDSAVSNAIAYSTNIEKLSANLNNNSKQLNTERAIAQEMERIAMHIADTGALCGDIGYQLGQVACEALRTITINTTQMWCGNRFGKSIIRPCGTNFPLNNEICSEIKKNMSDVLKRYDEIRQNIKNTPSVIARFEACGTVDRNIALHIGAVGVCAKASGLLRDIRATHPYGEYKNMNHVPIIKTYGDVMSRLTIRCREVLQSIEYVLSLVDKIDTSIVQSRPIYNNNLVQNAISVSIVEGWRGEICHTAITNSQGEICCYKVKDPSIHNWLALSLAVRGEGISDFPICNKSFSLSYCGHDL